MCPSWSMSKLNIVPESKLTLHVGTIRRNLDKVLTDKIENVAEILYRSKVSYH